IDRWDVFSIGAGGGGLTKITDSGPQVCPRPTATPGQFVADPTYVFASVAPSPSGDVTAVGGWKLVPLRPDCSSPGNNQYTGQAERGIYALGPGGARGALIRAGVVSGTGFDWEPTPVQLT